MPEGLQTGTVSADDLDVSPAQQVWVPSANPPPAVLRVTAHEHQHPHLRQQPDEPGQRLRPGLEFGGGRR